MRFRLYRGEPLVWWSLMGRHVGIGMWRRWVRPYRIKSHWILDVNTGFVLLMVRW